MSVSLVFLRISRLAEADVWSFPRTSGCLSSSKQLLSLPSSLGPFCERGPSMASQGYLGQMARGFPGFDLCNASLRSLFPVPPLAVSSFQILREPIKRKLSAKGSQFNHHGRQRILAPSPGWQRGPHTGRGRDHWRRHLGPVCSH